MKRSKRELKRIDWVIVSRVIRTLYKNGSSKKTFLATTCRMGFDKCGLYIDWLDMMDLIRRDINDSGFEEISLSEKGRSLYHRKFAN